MKKGLLGSFWLEAVVLIFAALVLLLINEAYGNFATIVQLNSELSEYQHRLRADVMSVHILVHEKPESEDLRQDWETQLTGLFGRMNTNHHQMEEILHSVGLSFDDELHESMDENLENLYEYGRLMISVEGNKFLQTEHEFDGAYESTMALMAAHQQEVKQAISIARAEYREQFEQLMITVLLLFVVMLGLLGWYQYRTARLHNRLQEQIRASWAITDNLVDGVITLDARGIIRAANSAVTHVLGYTVDELIGKSIETLMPPEHVGKHDAYVEKFLTTGVRKVIGVGRQTRARHKDGRLVSIYLGVSEYWLDGKHWFVGVLRDVTRELEHERDLLQAKERAEAGNRAKSEFLTAITHEVRTPLNGIIGPLSLLKSDCLEGQKEFVDLAYQSANDLLKLLDSVLAFNRMDSEHVVLQSMDIDLAQFSKDILREFQITADKKQLALHLELQSSLPSAVRLDVLRVREVVDHLLENAVKFTEKGSVTLSVSYKNSPLSSSVVFAVCDTGEGIAQENHELIFQAFKQVDGSITRRHGGLGLGLAICRRLTHLMNGSLTVQSEPGKGSCFYFELPVELVG